MKIHASSLKPPSY